MYPMSLHCGGAHRMVVHHAIRRDFVCDSIMLALYIEMWSVSLVVLQLGLHNETRTAQLGSCGACGAELSFDFARRLPS